MAADFKAWSLSDPDRMDPSDYIIGATRGLWSYDEDSMLQATVTVLAQVFAQAGLNADDALDKAYDTVVPADGERTLSISVTETDDGTSWKLNFKFGGED